MLTLVASTAVSLRAHGVLSSQAQERLGVEEKMGSQDQCEVFSQICLGSSTLRSVGAGCCWQWVDAACILEPTCKAGWHQLAQQPPPPHILGRRGS